VCVLSKPHAILKLTASLGKVPVREWIVGAKLPLGNQLEFTVFFDVRKE
jgi:hypothetical protein